MTHLVYPGALHTRFHHALGAMHLMTLAIENLRTKGQNITFEEEEGAILAILLHDIGHGPFSHALEHTLVSGILHETISVKLMHDLNAHFGGQLSLAIAIFNGTYPKKFLHQLISGQMDLDRMDYLNRDSFFTGVSEGVISFDRIIKMLNVYHGELVIEEKGIYSVEKFLIARRLMYWQVYLHKTVIAAEMILVKLLERAKEISIQGENLFASPSLSHFLKNTIDENLFFSQSDNLVHFTNLDDQDIYAALKVWVQHPDKVLSTLCKMLNTRNLYKVEMSNQPAMAKKVEDLKQKVADTLTIEPDLAKYFVFTESIKNRAYHAASGDIKILMKNNEITDITKASDLSNLTSLEKTVEKYVLCYPRGF